jgi:hypothetical protein
VGAFGDAAITLDEISGPATDPEGCWRWQGHRNCAIALLELGSERK